MVSSYDDATFGYRAPIKRQISDEALQTVRDNVAGSGIKATAITQEGHCPARDLIEIAKKENVDLIIAGTASHTGLGRVILGSTAEGLIRNAPCPVMTIGPNANPPEDKPLFFQRIIYATDFSTTATKAAIFALSFAEDSGARLFLCFVQSAPPAFTAKQLAEGRFQEALRQIVPETSYDWCNPEFIVEHGDAATAILGLADRVKADLIVLGAQKASFWLPHLEGSVAPDLIAQARSPVMTIC
jgi:nucleotide-binding universal stress UspA family protein